MYPHAESISSNEHYARLLGTELVSVEQDRAVVRLPYKTALGVGRIHGGAISSLVDIAATACFWAHSSINQQTRGATVGFTINFLRLADATDLIATASVRRRGGTISTGDVTVTDPEGTEVAFAVVTYKLSN